MEYLKDIYRILLCEHILEPFRAPRSSWKTKGTRAWCFWTTLAFLGASWCFGYTVYLTAIDAAYSLIGREPMGFVSWGLFAHTEHFELAARRHLMALVLTIGLPLHRVVYNVAISLFYGGFVETCEDEWPSEGDVQMRHYKPAAH